MLVIHHLNDNVRKSVQCLNDNFYKKNERHSRNSNFIIPCQKLKTDNVLIFPAIKIQTARIFS